VQGGAGSSGGDFGNTDVSMATDTQPAVMDSVAMDDGNCGATSVVAEQVVLEEFIEIEEEVTTVEPVAFYIMLDQSFSMVPLWFGAVAGIKAFVTDPMSDGIDVALDFFPGFGMIRGCDGSGYENPHIPMGRLPGHAPAITSTLDSLLGPTGIGTPIEGALRGATAFCANFQAQNPDEKCIAVLVTDGSPSGCQEDPNALVSIVAQAFSGGVITYGVGLAGSDFTLLNRISQEGGADDCDPGAQYACDVTASADQLVLALNRIRAAVTNTVTRVETVTTVVETPLACEWELPPPDSINQGFDKMQVNVKLSATELGAKQLSYVESESACAADAWYYDDATAPTRIIACPDTCSVIESSTGAAVDILLGCPTLVLE